MGGVPARHEATQKMVDVDVMDFTPSEKMDENGPGVPRHDETETSILPMYPTLCHIYIYRIW